ncbi:MAG: hypothetical protein ACLFV7_01595 [Phycisphaerae bacterium]
MPKPFVQTPIRYRIPRPVRSFGAGYVPLLIAGVALLVALAVVTSSEPLMLVVVVCVAAAVVLVASWSYGRSYLRAVEVCGDAVRLRFALRVVRVDAQRISDVRLLPGGLEEATALAGGTGTDGHEALAALDAYVYRPERPVVVLTADGRLPIVMDLEYPEQFVRDVATIAPQAMASLPGEQGAQTS